MLFKLNLAIKKKTPWSLGFKNDFVSVSVHALIKTRMFAVRLLQVHKRNASDARQAVFDAPTL